MTEPDQKNGKKTRKMRRQHTHTLIPVYLLFDPTITLAEAVVLAEIDALDGEDGCYAMNDHFGLMLRVTRERAGEIISGLVKKGWLVRRITPSGKGSKRYLAVVWPDHTHPVYLPGGHPVYPPGPPLENTGTHPIDLRGANIDENTRESTERGKETPPSQKFANLLKKIPDTKSGKLLAERIDANTFLPMDFTRWLIEQAVSRFEKKIDISETELSDWAEKFEEFGEEVFTIAIKRIRIADKTKGNLPSIGEMDAASKAIKAERAQPKRVPKPPEKTRTLAEKLAAMSPAELADRIEDIKGFPKAMQLFLRDYEKELKSRGLK